MSDIPTFNFLSNPERVIAGLKFWKNPHRSAGRKERDLLSEFLGEKKHQLRLFTKTQGYYSYYEQVPTEARFTGYREWDVVSWYVEVLDRDGTVVAREGAYRRGWHGFNGPEGPEGAAVQEGLRILGVPAPSDGGK